MGPTEQAEAEALAHRAAQARGSAEELLSVDPWPLPDPVTLKAFGKQFVPERQIRIVFSPLRG